MHLSIFQRIPRVDETKSTNDTSVTETGNWRRAYARCSLELMKLNLNTFSTLEKCCTENKYMNFTPAQIHECRQIVIFNFGGAVDEPTTPKSRRPSFSFFPSSKRFRFRLPSISKRKQLNSTTYEMDSPMSTSPNNSVNPFDELFIETYKSSNT
ncbi:hypothetical protein RF11_03364 [Thelohanellus kitauei]|uniref:Uncharacterized protein n=1 Tax=Thelohanellus kitauei TaxID=669202 RepID=A0A0C2JQE2_THEKT|nr:hypothetical protein RF11_03364 [Thelohanellus kitauei]